QVAHVGRHVVGDGDVGGGDAGTLDQRDRVLEHVAGIGITAVPVEDGLGRGREVGMEDGGDVAVGAGGRAGADAVVGDLADVEDQGRGRRVADLGGIGHA